MFVQVLIVYCKQTLWPLSQNNSFCWIGKVHAFQREGNPNSEIASDKQLHLIIISNKHVHIFLGWDHVTAALGAHYALQTQSIWLGVQDDAIHRVNVRLRAALSSVHIIQNIWVECRIVWKFIEDDVLYPFDSIPEKDIIWIINLFQLLLK